MSVRDVYAQLLNVEQRVEARKAELRREGLHTLQTSVPAAMLALAVRRQ
jgi:hypothetical protein